MWNISNRIQMLHEANELLNERLNDIQTAKCYEFRRENTRPIQNFVESNSKTYKAN